MKKVTIIAIIFISALLIGFLLLRGFASLLAGGSPFGGTEGVTFPEIKQLGIENTKIVDQDDIAVVELQNVELETVSFTLPDDWVVDGADLAYEDKFNVAGIESVSYVTPVVTTHTVNAGMGGLPTEGVKDGARLSVSIVPAQVADSIADAQKYAEFQTANLDESFNALEGEIITMAGAPAAYTLSFDVENVVGGFATVEQYYGGQIISVRLKYGIDNTFEDYRDVFFNVVESVKLKE